MTNKQKHEFLRAMYTEPKESYFSGYICSVFGLDSKTILSHDWVRIAEDARLGRQVREAAERHVAINLHIPVQVPVCVRPPDFWGAGLALPTRPAGDKVPNVGTCADVPTSTK